MLPLRAQRYVEITCSSFLATKQKHKKQTEKKLLSTPNWRTVIKIELYLISINDLYGSIIVKGFFCLFIWCFFVWDYWDKEKHTVFPMQPCLKLVQLDLRFQDLNEQKTLWCRVQAEYVNTKEWNSVLFLQSLLIQ